MAGSAQPLQRSPKDPLFPDFFDASIRTTTVTTGPLPGPAIPILPVSNSPSPPQSQLAPSSPLPRRTPSPIELPGDALPPRASSDPSVPTIRHKSSQTWHHSGPVTRPGPSPRLQPSPRSLSARNSLAPVQTLSLPTSATPSASESSRPQSLMRRVSQKAANKLRRRAPSSAQDHTERSGPVTVRNRSESATGEYGLGIQHNDSLDDDDDVAETTRNTRKGGFESAAEETALVAPKKANRHSGSVGVVVPDELQRGTMMTRVTRKKKVQRLFKLNINSALVSWDNLKASSRFFIDDMKEVRTGANARNYREELGVSADEEPRWITVIYIDPENSKLKLLHIIAPTDRIFTIWTTTLEAINRYRIEMMAGLAMQGENFVEAHWKKYMASLRSTSGLEIGPDRVTFEDVERLCRSIHVNCSRRFLKEKFKHADHDRSGYLNFREFEEFVKLLKERDEIKDLWSRLVHDKHDGMHITEFREFLRDVQKVDIEADSGQVDKVFRKFCRHSLKMNSGGRLLPAKGEDVSKLRMSQDAFAAFLSSSTYNPPLLLPAATGQTLDQPLNEYYCSSSHNTYLMGRQFVGESSVEGYIKVLQRGCRCVEIDCWDGDDGRPVVTHGHTGTSQCLFSDVISTINKYAFFATPYPIILSLEVHCSLDQQIKMAEILCATFGEQLVTEPFMTNAMILPSPEELKNRILIKVKGAQREETALLKADLDALDRRLSPGGRPRPGGVFTRSNTSSSAGTTTSESEDQSAGAANKPKTPKAARKIAQELGRLGVYCRGQKFRNFALPESKTFNHVFSFQEKAFLKFCKDPEKKVQLEKHNVRYMMRVYPSGIRVNSSNFEPLGFWRRGVQMVALNWQTYDLGIQLNDAMFASGSDRCGYVLKPKPLRGSRNMFDPLGDAAEAKLKKDKKQITFSIEVISAQQLPRPKDHKPDETIDPFVEVEVFTADDKAKGGSGEGGVDLGDSKGVSGLGAPQKRRTKVVRDDGFRPLFREKMKFSLVTKFEGLVFLRFSMYSAHGGDDRILIATYTAKLISLQQGYRHLPLFDTQGEQYLFSTLFVKIDVAPMTVVDGDVPTRVSTMTTLKTSAKSVLSRGFSVERRAASRRAPGDDRDHSSAFGETSGIVSSPIAMTGPFPSAF